MLLSLADAKPRQPWTWADVASVALPDDLASVRVIAAAAIAEVEARADAWADVVRQRFAIEAAIMARFVRELGPMAAGWCWARDEGTFGGGVVSAWCCPPHSVPTPADREALSTTEIDVIATRAAAGLLEWRAHLLSVRDAIEACDPPDEGLAIERAVTRLADLAAAATGCGDAWYNHAAQVIAWYLQRHGVHDAEAVARDAVRGRFASWAMPASETVHEVGAAVSRTIARRRAEVDALAVHLATRVEWYTPPPDIAERCDRLVRQPSDGAVLAPHFALIECLDALREDGALRAERMRAALTYIVDDVNRDDDALPADVLRRAHAIAMGNDGMSPWRRAEAFAKGGREMYGMPPGDSFEQMALYVWSGPITNATSAYLDLCFYHPFDDGNARAARLALAWFAVHDGLVFADLLAVVSTPRVAGDIDGYWGLCRTLLDAAERGAKMGHRPVTA